MLCLTGGSHAEIPTQHYRLDDIGAGWLQRDSRQPSNISYQQSQCSPNAPSRA
jgi:hypothetical protein